MKGTVKGKQIYYFAEGKEDNDIARSRRDLGESSLLPFLYHCCCALHAVHLLY